ncbi:protein mobE (plasmid) [Burkholderia sp. PAMC 28687]|uniref:DUF6753 family protein n=1 Tax=Burkholderia sp. PAMC 28687 TaxID=1795874 RepID=UPI0007813E9C|nr:DUF6753 family protein [Burkholderia sp. PAMC 28687]AMM18808.1 protein mobE [Burkholderia sp. PAMC 28687]
MSERSSIPSGSQSADLFNDLDESFAKLLGRQPSDAERQKLYMVRDALGLKNNDALWLVLMALQHYQTQYETIPTTISQTASDTLKDLKSAADATMQASAEAAKADLAEAVANAAQKVAVNTSRKQMWKWAAGCIAIAFLSFGLFGAFVYYKTYTAGVNSGYGMGYNEAKDEKAAAAWANTPQGRLAYRFAQTGSLDSLMKCDRPGWSEKKGVCYPYQTADGNVYGWRIP